jgi:hypothetical protein
MTDHYQIESPALISFSGGRTSAYMLRQILDAFGGRLTAEIVSTHLSEHQVRSGLGRLRRGDRPPGYTIIEIAKQLDIDPQWIYRGIAKGRIEISKDSKYGCYLFPRTKAAVARMKELKCGKVRHVTFRKKHGDG